MKSCRQHAARLIDGGAFSRAPVSPLASSSFLAKRTAPSTGKPFP
jgi:hypothetical protein